MEVTLDAALRESGHFISRIFDITHNLIYIYDIAEKRNSYTNREIWDFLGYTSQQIQTLGPSLMSTILHPDDTLAVARHHARFLTLDDNKVLEIEYRMKRADGRYRWLRSREMVFSRDASGRGKQIFGIAEDITVLKRFMKVLMESEEKFRSYVEQAPDGVFVTDGTGRFLEANKALCMIMGYDEKELLNLCMHDLLAEESLENGLAHFKMLTDMGMSVADIFHRHRNGSKICLSISAIKLSNNKFLGFAKNITQRIRVEEKLIESEKRYRTLIEQASDGIFLNGDDGKYIEVNTAGCKLLGYSREEILRLTLQDVVKATPDSPLSIKELREGKSVLRERELVRKDGTTVTVEINAKKIANGLFQGIARDITDRKLSQQKLQLSEAALKKAQKVAHVGNWVLHIKTNRVEWLDDMESLFGIDQKSFSGDFNELIARAIHPDDLSIIENSNRSVFEGKKPTPVEFRIIWPDKTIHSVWLETDEILLDSEGKPDIITGIAQDVTERKLLEEELQKAHKLESLGVLAGGIAHDFNNLLAGIFGYIDMARESCETESKTAVYLDKALKTFSRAKDLTQQILTFAKGGAPVRKPGALAPLLKECVQFSLTGSGVSCSFEVADGLRICDFDENQIGQVIDNIVINAVQAMPLGGTIKVDAENAEVTDAQRTSLKPGSYVHVCISDTGIGIPASILPRIFDPFFTTKQKGNGMGLATAYSIIKKHGGDICAESEPDKGTRFHLYLPVSEKIVGSQTVSKTLIHQGSGRILIMDDEESIRETVGDMITMMGYHVDYAMNGQNALAMIDEAAKTGKPYTAVIMDLTIPGAMGGKETVAQLRKTEENLIVFVSSGYSEDPVMAYPARYGFNDKIKKPFRKSELADLFNRHFK
jgi:PAS domain S-box-containing protein